MNEVRHEPLLTDYSNADGGPANDLLKRHSMPETETKLKFAKNESKQPSQPS